MKTLIKPMFGASWVLVLSALAPNVPFYAPLLGFASLVVIGIMGIYILGIEDREILSQLEQMRLKVLQVEQIRDGLFRNYDEFVKKQQEIETRVSKALADVRTEAGRLR